MANSLSTGKRAALMGAVAVQLCALVPAAWAEPCGGDRIATGVVQRAVDGRTIELENGRIVRLAGIDLSVSGSEAPAVNASERARLSLHEALVQKTILVKNHKVMTDRHGRLSGFVFLPEVLEASVQHAMLQQGVVRVSGRAGDRACAASLLAQERKAREAKRGLWSDLHHAPLPAAEPAAVLARRGTFVLVEGRVLSVRESGGTIYVNFGRRWTEDFTVTIAKRNERMLAADGLDAKRLDRRLVRVRGYVEERGGPWIEVTRPEQVEVTR
jgi:endonuclease YncB( thermonuclease family)